MIWQAQGRQRHGWFGTGTGGAPMPPGGMTNVTRIALQAQVIAAATGPTASRPPSYVAAEPDKYLGGKHMGGGECVDLVKDAVPTLPPTSQWVLTRKVQDNPGLPRGTIIASRADGPNTSYGNRPDGSSHAAILDEWTPKGMWVIDQWNTVQANGATVPHRPARRFLSFTEPGRAIVNRGDKYYVVD